MLAVNQLTGFGGGVGSASVVFTDHTASSTDLTTYTFSSRALGEPSGSRHIIVAVLASTSLSATTVSTLTVGGFSASLAKRATATLTSMAEIWIAAVPTGTTGDVVVTFNAAQTRMAIGVWAAYDLLSATPTDTGESNADPGNISIDVDAGGIIVSGVYSNTNTAMTYTWTNLTEVFEIVTETTRRTSGASDSFAAAQAGLSITVDASIASSQLMVAAAFR